MKRFAPALFLLSVMTLLSCSKASDGLRIYQTSQAGDKLADKGKVSSVETRDPERATLVIHPEQQYQEITGFGGAFTESSAYVLSKLSKAKRTEVIRRYFGSDGAAYSLTRTHINSCDFSLQPYSYAAVPGDTGLANFSIQEDMDDLVPLIQNAMKASSEGFKILASPWTAPPWMKDNEDWFGGSLKPEYYSTWALYFAKTIKAYQAQGIPIWGVTVENEPLGNGGQWESMIFTPQTEAQFVKEYLAPQLKKEGLDTKILIYDQNRDELEEWAAMLDDPDVANAVWGTAVHWYSSTTDWYPDALNAVHEKYPDKMLMHTEGCIDNVGNDEPAGVWLKDEWYWNKEATDWGFFWAAEADRDKHPAYVPVYRYARDIIGGLNSWLTGWIDWNMVLDFQGGPNHKKNWCVAPVLADPETDTVYYTPLYYVMAHFSKFIRPGAHRTGLESTAEALMAAACQNADGSIALAILNQGEQAVRFQVELNKRFFPVTIPGRAIQTLMIR